MILSFMTKHKDGKPTFFIDKIWDGLMDSSESNRKFSFYVNSYHTKFKSYWDCLDGYKPKLHTIREDSKNRWKAGMKIHFTIFPRNKKMFQFAPVIECKSVQKIEIKDVSDLDIMERNFLQEIYVESLKETFFKAWQVKVDGRKLTIIELHKLALNDGFDSVNDFFEWFNHDFTGKIIHWTDLKY